MEVSQNGMASLPDKTKNKNILTSTSLKGDLWQAYD